MLAATPHTLAQLVAEAGAERLDAAAPGEWSARVVLAHLRDDEALVMRLRLERILAEDEPLLAVFDEKAWAAGRHTARDRKEQLLGDFALQRQASLNVLRGMPPGAWERTTRHPEYGRFTLRWWVEHWLDHDATHVAQVEASLGETLGDVLARRARRH